MDSPGETEAGGLIETMIGSSGDQLPCACCTNHRIERPSCLENSLPKGGILTNGVRRVSIPG
jgi:hypothetical protein